MKIFACGICIFLSVTKVYAQVEFVPDSVINRMVILENATSVEKSLGDCMPLLDKNADLPSVVFYNVSGTQYLKLIFHPGNPKNQFSYFEVGSTNDKPQKNRKKPSKTSSQNFTTQSGIRLGMSKRDLVSIKGFKYRQSLINKTQVIDYKIDNIKKSDFLRRYNMPEYTARYFFQKDILIKFSFGFEYP